MKTLFSLSLICLALFACKTETGSNAAAEAESSSPAIAPVLTEKWAATGLKTPESVLYDATQNVLYVANINGSPTDKDGNGFISKLNLNGEVVALEWVSGLDAPKGMAISGGKFYVSDIDQLVEIDLASAQITNRHVPGDATFLNDVAAGSDGTIYVSDTRANKLYRLKNGDFEIWLEGEPLDAPNGLFVEGSTLLSGNKNKVLAIDITTGDIRSFVDSTGTGNITDGLVPDGKGSYFTSNWQGGTWLIHPENAPLKLLDTSADTINSADLEYIISQRLLLIPTFFDDRVVAYEWK